MKLPEILSRKIFKLLFLYIQNTKQKNSLYLKLKKLKYDIPNYLSKEAVECVKGILQADPNQRWTGTQIQNSCLFKKNMPFKDDSTSFMASVMKLPPPPIVRLPQLKPKDNSKLVKDQTINRV